MLRLLASSSQKSWPFLERGSSLSAKLHGEWEWEGTPAGDGKHFPYKLGLDGILLKTPPPLFVFFRRPNPGKEPTLFHGGPMPQPGPTTLSLFLSPFSISTDYRKWQPYCLCPSLLLLPKQTSNQRMRNILVPSPSSTHY